MILLLLKCFFDSFIDQNNRSILLGLYYIILQNHNNLFYSCSMLVKYLFSFLYMNLHEFLKVKLILMYLTKLESNAGSSSIKVQVLERDRSGWFIRGKDKLLNKLPSLKHQLVGHFIPPAALLAESVRSVWQFSSPAITACSLKL